MVSRDTKSGAFRRGWSSLLWGVSTGEESQGSAWVRVTTPRRSLTPWETRMLASCDDLVFMTLSRTRHFWDSDWGGLSTGEGGAWWLCHLAEHLGGW